MACNLTDVITCAKFQDDIFMDYNFTGVEFPIFLFSFEWALQQFSATELPVIPIIDVSVGDISHAFETAKSLFDVKVCKTPDAPYKTSRCTEHL